MFTTIAIQMYCPQEIANIASGNPTAGLPQIPGMPGINGLPGTSGLPGMRGIPGI
jgi:hypothetical protein